MRNASCWHTPNACNFVVTLLLAAFLLLATPAWGQTSLRQQKRGIDRASTLLRSSERLAATGKREQATAAITEARELLRSLSTDIDPKLTASYQRATAALTATQAKLKGLGVEVGDESALPDPTTTLDEMGPGRIVGNETTAETGSISFASQVAPLLVQKCGRCHVDGSRGEVNFASFSALQASGLIAVGSGAESRLVEVIASGEMPPGRDKVDPEHTRLLVDWINQGATFDGADPQTPLGELTSVTPAPELPTPPRGRDTAGGRGIRKPSGGETVSFALDVAPLLVANCLDCHGVNNPRAGLRLTNFLQLENGGDSGAIVVPGDPEGSLLVQKLRGTAAAGARMPVGQPALEDASIELIATWIREQATFDGDEPGMNLARLADLARAKSFTPEQLSAYRRELANKQWRLAIPDEAATTTETQQLLMMGNLPAARLDEIGQQSEAVLTQLAAMLGGSELSKAKVTMYCFANRTDWSEFATMVERTELPADTRGSWHADAVHPYVCLLTSDDTQPEFEPLLTEQLGALWFAAQADKAPRWLATGAGRAVAAKRFPKSVTVSAWRQSVADAVAQQRSPDDFMQGKLSPSAESTLAFSFVDGLLRKPASVQKLMAALQRAPDFDSASKEAFGMDGPSLAAAWLRSQSSSKR